MYVLNHEGSGIFPASSMPLGFGGLGDAAVPFDGDATLLAWATNLADLWSKRAKKDAAEQATFAAAKLAWLTKDYRDFLAGCQKRKGLRKFKKETLLRAWRVAREEDVDFRTFERHPFLPKTFRPPTVPLAPSPHVDDSGSAPVAPLMAAFSARLKSAHPKVRIDTYPKHGGGAFESRGFSVDLWLPKSPLDARGFHQPADAIALLRAVHQTARAMSVEWRALYNDYRVARVINQETGVRHVGFVGNIRPNGSINWHGPSPLLLHFHLDIAPLSAGGGLPVASPSVPTPAPKASSGASAVSAAARAVASSVNNVALTAAIVARISTGERDPNRLTNAVFYARHPELPAGYKIKASDQALVREWVAIRDGAVRPLLARFAAKPASVPSTAPAPSAPAPALSVGPLGRLVLDAPGFPRFSYAFTPEDLLWTARFIKGESGGKDDLDGHAVVWAMLNRYALFTHKYYPTFHQFVRAYSTPLQPVLKSPGAAKRHMHKATFVKTGGTYAPTHPEVPKGQLQNHLVLQKAPWSSLPAGARRVAEAALTGKLVNPIGPASEFGSTYVYFNDHNERYPNDAEWRDYTERYARKKKWVWVGPVAGLNQKSNAFFIQARAAKLPKDAVRVVG
jgi:hypothetical protein